MSRAEEKMQASVWSMLYSWSLRKKNVSEEAVRASAEVNKKGGLLSADTAQ